MSDEFNIDSPEWSVMNRKRAALIHKKVYEGLTTEEQIEYERLQKGSLEALDARFPRPDFSDLEELMKRLK